MRKKFSVKVCSMIMAAAMILTMTSCGSEKNEGKSGQENNQEEITSTQIKELENGEVELTKTPYSNPIAGYSNEGDYTYGGDPSVLVDGDTVYLYTGHDKSSDSEVGRRIYNIPEYLCYSSKDLKNWKAEGSVMEVSTSKVKWVTSSNTAWASQVYKHHDPEDDKDKYYLYYCSWDKTSMGKQSIGVAVSDSPTGQFEDIGKPLVQGTETDPQNSNWDDIDPTVWVDTDENGEEHRYLGWGNSKFYICELNEDMISVKDIDGDGKIKYSKDGDKGDIFNHQIGLSSYTEAPWIYRRKDESGKSYGKYYLFYASGWRERMAYSTTDDILKGMWESGNILMTPTATSNTNHLAVFDFKGKTYFVYHNGSLPAGNGYRRSACITELKFTENGEVEPMLETAAGLYGIKTSIKTMDGETICHEKFINSSGDNEYPYMDKKIGIKLSEKEEDGQWVIMPGKADEENKAYVSIQSENKPGLYMTAKNDKVTLCTDDDAKDETAQAQTFRTVKGLSGELDSVSFESLSEKGKYISLDGDELVLSDGKDGKAASFKIS